MHKKIAALAVAGLAASSAFAQSNVTAYGVIDVGYNQIRSDGRQTAQNIDSSQALGSRIGFKGEEDLGNGLKALFVLEYQISPDTNTGVGTAMKWSGSVARQQYVGLSSNYGTVTAGRLQTAGFTWACSYSPLTGGIFATDLRLGAKTSLECGSGGRSDNAVAYQSPKIAGFQVEVDHARKTETASTTGVGDDFQNIVGVTYENGGLKIGGVYNYLKRSGNDSSVAAASRLNDIKEYGLGASYDFKVVKLFATYARNHEATKDAESKYQIGAAVPVTTNGTVMASFAANSMIGNNTDSNAWAMAYFHNLSKRTTVYGGYVRVSNDSGAQRGAGSATDALPVLGGNSSAVAFGVRHLF